MVSKCSEEHSNLFSELVAHSSSDVIILEFLPELLSQVFTLTQILIQGSLVFCRCLIFKVPSFFRSRPNPRSPASLLGCLAILSHRLRLVKNFFCFFSPPRSRVPALPKCLHSLAHLFQEVNPYFYIFCVFCNGSGCVLFLL